MTTGQKVQRKGNPASNFVVVGALEGMILVSTPVTASFGAGRLFAFKPEDLELVAAPALKASPGVIYEKDGLIYVGLTNGKVMDTTWDKEHDFDPTKMKVVSK